MRSLYTNSPLHPDTVNWQARVNEQGGRISNKTAIFTDRVIKYCYAVGLRDPLGINHKLKFWLPLATNTLEGLFVPVWHPDPTAICTNNNIVAADYSLTGGIQFNGASKYIDSLFNASLLGESAYIACHSTTELASNTVAMGAADFQLPYRMLAFIPRWSDGIAYYSNRTINSYGALTPSSIGFFAAFTSEGSNYIYHNLSQLGTNAFAANPPPAPNYNIFLGARNDQGSAGTYSSRRLCCFLIGENVTAAQHEGFALQQAIWDAAVRSQI